jgi:SpoVK/Ycf46/Vps4 family AAA+-type ATPase
MTRSLAVAASEMIQELIRAHVAGNAERFRTIALQLAANEARLGHRKVAGRIRDLIDEEASQRKPPAPTPLARPSRDLRGVLVTSYPKERLRDIVLGPSTSTVLERVLREHRSKGRLASHGLVPRRKVLFYGPPGCGKTLAASVIAGELGLPLVRIRVETIFSRYLGETAGLLADVFQEMDRVRGVYLFDEFDAIARRRGDSHDVGEAKRIVSTFLQLLDGDASDSLIIAATNLDDQIDRAVFRRFDDVAEFPLPDKRQRERLITMRTAGRGLPSRATPEAARQAEGLSFADIARAVDDALKAMVLADRNRLQAGDLYETIREVLTRPSTK